MHKKISSFLYIHLSPENHNNLNEISYEPKQVIMEPDKADNLITLDIAIAIPLPSGDVAFIDKIDCDLSNMSWHISKTKGYAQHKITDESGKRKYRFLHRIIGERIINRPLTHDDFIEHNNGNKLDNRRKNLSLLTRSESVQRYEIRNSNKTIYKGISYRKSRNKWQARIKFHGQTRSLGYYSTPEEAAKAYNKAAIELYGEKARLNILPEKSNTPAENPPNSRRGQGNNEQKT